MKDNESIIYELLREVFIQNAYSSIKLNDMLMDVEEEASRAYITRVFYGVIEKSIQFDYIISRLAPKKPKNSIVILIKIGLYLLKYTGTAEYAAVNKVVALCRAVGKSGASGFVNAVLRKSVGFDVSLQNFSSKEERLSVIYSCPSWIVELLIREYGEEEVIRLLSYKKKEGTHIRHNISQISREQFSERLYKISKEQGCLVEDSGLGFYVKHSVMEKIPSHLFTAQSYASMIAVHSYTSQEEIEGLGIKRVLDVCAAPGGKSVLLKQLFPNLSITACDVHPHRLKLIKDYALRMGVELSVALNDGRRLVDEWKNAFDLVICDVPCSGLGVVNSKPDIALNRSVEDIFELSTLQLEILNTAARYVKKNGILSYSTCTILPYENNDVIQKFLEQNGDFELMPIKVGRLFSAAGLQLLPHIHDCDAFYVAKMKRK